MSDNWELGVTHARGDYITVLGDDDALLCGALQEADRLLRELNVEALRWHSVYYYWPDFLIPAWANRMTIPLDKENAILLTEPQIDAVVNGNAWYVSLPMLYNSFISRAIIARIKSSAGRIFSGCSPDIYSGFAVAHTIDRFASSAVPFGIVGLSGRSNGMMHLYGDPDNPTFTEFNQLNEANGLGWHRSIPYYPRSFAAIVAESFQVAMESLHPVCCGARFDPADLAFRIIDELRCAANMTRPDLLDAAQTIAETLCPSNVQITKKLVRFAESAGIVNGPPLMPKGFTQGNLYLDTTDFGVGDIVAATRLVMNILGRVRNHLSWPIRSAHSSRPLPFQDRVKSWFRDGIPPALWRVLRRMRATVN